MDNVMKAIEQKGYEIVFLPNSVHSSYTNITQKYVEIGIQTRFKAHFDYDAFILAHEAGHVLDENEEENTIPYENEKANEIIFAEIKAWKTAFEEFLPNQPILRLEMLKWAQLCLFSYISNRIYKTPLTETEFDANGDIKEAEI